MRKNIRDYKFQFFSYAILVVTFAILVLFMHARLDYLLGADESSELLLGKLLAEENHILSQNWYYSTELRFLNTQLIYALCFKLFHNWHVVRVVASAILYLIMLTSYYFLCRQLKCQKYFALTASILLLPFSAEYFIVVLKGLYYIPHISISFLSIGLLLRCLHAQKTGTIISSLVLGAGLAFVASLGGIRQMVVTYLPLMLVAGIVILYAIFVFQDWTKILAFLKDPYKWRLIIFSFACGICGFLGFLVNSKILVRYYNFSSWGNIELVNFDINALGKVLAGFFATFGYRTGNVFSRALISFAVCLLLLAMTIHATFYGIHKCKEKNKDYYLLSGFMVSAVMVFTVLYTFTSAPYADRYNLPIIVWAIPICLLNLLYGPWKKQFRILISVILLGSILFVGNVHLIAQLNEDDNKELRDAITFLKQEGYTQGYSTYWKGNLTTELSDGDIEMWIMCDDAAGAGIAEVQDVHTVFCWLQNKSHDNNFPKGKQFMMLTRNEYSRCNWQDKLLLENADYLSDELVIFGFDSEEDLMHTLGSSK